MQTGWQQNVNGRRFKVGTFQNDYHYHDPDYLDAEQLRAREALRTEASSSNPGKTRRVVDNVRSQMSMGSRIRFKQRAMKKFYNGEKLKQETILGARGLDNPDPQQIVFPNELQDLIIYDNNVNGQRMLVFSSEWSLELLENCDLVACDGTFSVSFLFCINIYFTTLKTLKSAPRGFAQLYQMFGIIDSCAIPLVHAFLPGKTPRHYLEFFESIRQQLSPNWAPHIMTDFEDAAINAINQIYPASNKHACIFHLGQSIYRKIQKLPVLRQRYSETEDNRIQLKSFQALAFVPEEYLYPYFVIALASLFEWFPGCRNEIHGLDLIKFLYF